MTRNLDMTQGRPLRLLVLFALPLMLGNTFQQLYTVVDTAIVGRGVGMEALAALGTVDWLNWMMIGVVAGFAQGFSVLVAQKYGERDFAGLRRLLGQSALLSIAIAVVSTAVMEAGLPLFTRLLKVPPELTGMALTYSRILMGGLPAMVFYNYSSGILRAVGDSRTPLVAMITAAVTNIVLDCLAVFVLDWGIGGAAAATVFAQCLSGVICARRIGKTPELHFTLRDLCPDRTLSASLLRLGAPLAGKNIIIAVGGMVVQSIVNGFGTGFIAGFTATNKLYGLLEICALSFGYAVTTYVGQNYGAGAFARIRAGMKAAFKLSMGTASVIGVAMLILGRPIVRLFMVSSDPAQALIAENVGYTFLCLMSVCLPVLYIVYICQSALQGMGNSMVSMLAGTYELISRIGVAVLVSIVGWEYGILGAEIGAWWIAAAYSGWQYLRWMKTRLPE